MSLLSLVGGGAPVRPPPICFKFKNNCQQIGYIVCHKITQLRYSAVVIKFVVHVNV